MARIRTVTLIFTAVIFVAAIPASLTGWQTWDPASFTVDEIVEASTEAHGLDRDLEIDSLALAWVMTTKGDQESRHDTRRRNNSDNIRWSSNRPSSRSPDNDPNPRHFTWHDRIKHVDGIPCRRVYKASAYQAELKWYAKSLGSLFAPTDTRGGATSDVWLVSPKFYTVELELRDETEEIDFRSVWVLEHPCSDGYAQYYIDCESKLVTMYGFVKRGETKPCETLKITEFQEVDGIKFPKIGEWYRLAENGRTDNFDFRVNVIIEK